MASTKDAERVRVVVCANSELEGIDRFKEVSGEIPLSKISSLGDISRRLMLDDLKLDPAAFYVRFHAPNQCKGLLSKWQIEPSSDYEHRNEVGTPIIYAHVMPKFASDLPLSPTEADQSFEGGFTEELPEKTPRSMLSESPEASKSNPSNSELSPGTSTPEAGHKTSRAKEMAVTGVKRKASRSLRTNPEHNKNEVKADADEHFEYIRIGTIPCVDDPDDDVVKRGIVVVAQMPRKRYRKEFHVTFRAVDVWNTTGVPVGHCEVGDKINIDRKNSYDPDPEFQSKSKQKVIIPLLTEIVDYGYVIDPSPAGSKKKRSKEQWSKKQVQNPVIPTYAPYGASPDGLRKLRAASHVAVVVFFKNEINEQNLDLNINQQFGLDSTDTYADFENLIRKGDGFDKVYTGLDRVKKLSSIRGGFQLEIWVLPHIKDSSTLYCWTNSMDWNVGDWLSNTITKEKGRSELYVEVHILPRDGDSKQKKTKTTHETESEDNQIEAEDEYEESAGSLSRKKGKGRKV